MVLDFEKALFLKLFTILRHKAMTTSWFKLAPPSTSVISSQSISVHFRQKQLCRYSHTVQMDTRQHTHSRLRHVKHIPDEKTCNVFFTITRKRQIHTYWAFSYTEGLYYPQNGLILHQCCQPQQRYSNLWWGVVIFGFSNILPALGMRYYCFNAQDFFSSHYFLI